MRFIVGIVAAALLAAAGSAEAQTKLKIGFGPASAWMPAFVAKDQGIFEKHGLDVSFEFVPIGSNEPSALMSGSIQVATLNPTILLFADEGGAEMQAVAGAVVQTRDHPFGGVLARDGSGIKAPADFRGKKIGVPGLNSVMHVAFMKWLKSKGVDPAQVTFIEAPMPQMSDLLKSGQIDAAIPVEPFLGRIEQSKTGYMVSRFPGELANPAYIDAFYGMMRDYIAANPKVVAEFRAAIREGTEWVEKNPEAARKTQVTYLHLPEAVAMSVELPNFTAEVTAAEMQFWIDACRELGVTQGTTTIDQVLAK